MSATRAASFLSEEAGGGLYPAAFSIDTGFGRCIPAGGAAAILLTAAILAVLLPTRRTLPR